jgi:DNA topoisomerase-2
VADQEQKYLVKGLYQKLGEDKIRITELPVGTWTMPYITFLEGLMDGSTDKAGKKIAPSIKDFTSVCTEVAVDITVQFAKGRLAELESTTDASGQINGLEKLLKLTTTISTTNMHMFDHQCRLKKYATVEHVIEDFYGVRIEMYGKRKAHLVDELRKKLVKLSNRAKYILETLDGSIDLRKKTGQQITDLLTSRGFALIDGDFKYLIKMPMDSVSEENVAHIMKEKGDAEQALAQLLATTVEQMWLQELDVLSREYAGYKLKRERIQAGSTATGAGGGPKNKVVNKMTNKVVKIHKKVVATTPK